MLKTIDWIAGALTIGGIVPLVGLPGTIPLVAAAPVLEVVYRGRFMDALGRMSSSAWGVALILTLIWTPALSPVWRLVERAKPGLTLGKQIGWTCLGMWAWALVTTFLVAELLIKPRQMAH